MTSGPRPGPAPAAQARARASSPARSSWHVTEGERAQEGAERGGRQHAVTEHLAAGPGAQEVTVLDGVGAGQDGVHHGHDLAPRPSGARSLAEVHHLVEQGLQPEALGERGRQEEPRIRHRAPIVEAHFERVQRRPWPGRAVLPRRHHMGDLLSAGVAAARTARLACSGGHSDLSSGRNPALQAVDPG
jgi:hypothetical protein